MAEFKDKLVVVIKEGLEIGKAMMSLSHAMLGFATSQITKEDVRINKYEDVDGNLHDNISEMPIVVLRAGSNKIRNLRKAAIEKGLKFVDFVDTMSIGTYEEEFNLTKTKKDQDLDYWAIVLYGDVETIYDLTHKFSLYK